MRECEGQLHEIGDGALGVVSLGEEGELVHRSEQAAICGGSRVRASGGGDFGRDRGRRDVVGFQQGGELIGEAVKERGGWGERHQQGQQCLFVDEQRDLSVNWRRGT